MSRLLNGPNERPTVQLDSGTNWVLTSQYPVTDTTFDNLLNGTYNVLHYGATGDGVTDDTAAIQAAIDAAVTGSTPTGRVYVPAGDYAISAALDIPYTIGFELHGAGRRLSRIIQQTDNTPILSIESDPWTQYLRIADLGLEYETQQESTDTGAFSIHLGGDAVAAPFALLFERLYLSGGFRGIYADTSAGDAVPWGITIADCSFQKFSGSAIYSTDSIGKPNWALRNLYIANTLAGSPTATEAAISVAGALTFTIQNLDIEGWANQHMIITGGTNPVLIDGYHMEHSTWTGTGDLWVNSIGNSGFIARGVNVQGTVNKSAGDTFLFVGNGDTDALCIIDGMQGDLTLTSGAAVPMLLGGGAVGYVRGILGTWSANPTFSWLGAGFRQVDDHHYLPTKAGTPTDSDIPLPIDGALVVDTTNDLLYVRSGGAWVSTALT